MSKVEKKTEERRELKIVCWNIANANRDEQCNPLGERFDRIIQQMKDMEPDLVCLLEAGRPSMGKSWTFYASLLEEATGLVYAGIKYAAPHNHLVNRPFSLGKAFFYNPKTTSLASIDQHYIPPPPTMITEASRRTPWVDPRHNGNDACIVSAWISKNSDGFKLDEAVRVQACFVHLPMDLHSRLESTDWLTSSKISGQVDVIMGDFNTFPDEGGPEMMERLTRHYRETLPANTKLTFSAFENDVCKKPKDTILDEACKVVAVDEEFIYVRFASWLDHALVDTNRFDRECTSKVVPMSQGESDHHPILLTIF